MREECVNPDAAIARIAARQHGRVTLEQLDDAGISRSGISRRVRAGRLHRVHRGVYAVGHPGVTSEGRWMAAVLACGEGAVLSHRSAAELWGLLAPTVGRVHVTVPASKGGRRQRPGLHIHRSLLPEGATTSRDNIPVTTPARTIVDLRRTVAAAVVRRAIRDAEFQGLDLDTIATDRTRSELERAFLRLCRRFRLPQPEINARLGVYTVDFLWRAERLVVETDGYRAHRGQQAFEDDHERELELALLGFRVRRFTYQQVRRHPGRVAAAVERALRSRP